MRRKAKSLLLLAYSVYRTDMHYGPFPWDPFPWDFFPQYTPFAFISKFYHGSTPCSPWYPFHLLSCLFNTPSRMWPFFYPLPLDWIRYPLHMLHSFRLLAIFSCNALFNVFFFSFFFFMPIILRAKAHCICTICQVPDCWPCVTFEKDLRGRYSSLLAQSSNTRRLGFEWLFHY